MSEKRAEDAVELYTDAPEAYDGFSTRTLAVVGEARNGNPVRHVRMESRDHHWQTARYASGCNRQTWKPGDLETFVEFGDWTLYAEPVPHKDAPGCCYCGEDATDGVTVECGHADPGDRYCRACYENYYNVQVPVRVVAQYPTAALLGAFVDGFLRATDGDSGGLWYRNPQPGCYQALQACPPDVSGAEIVRIDDLADSPEELERSIEECAGCGCKPGDGPTDGCETCREAERAIGLRDLAALCDPAGSVHLVDPALQTTALCGADATHRMVKGTTEADRAAVDCVW
jgi:hypothetical protein